MAIQWKNWPLAMKLTLVMTLLVVTAVAGVCLAFIYRERQVARYEMQEQAKIILDSLAVASSDAIYFSDTNKLSDIARRLEQTPNLSNVRFYDSRGRLIGDAYDPAAVQRFEPDPLGRSLIESDSASFMWLEDRLVAGRAITIGRTSQGAISVGISTRPLSARQAAIRYQGLVVALAAAVVGAAASWLISRPVTLPLKELAAAARSIGRGEFRFTSRIDREDEVGVLSRSFAEMAGHLAEFREGLEKRTEELAQTADRLRNSTVSIHYLDNIMASMADTLIVVDTDFKIRKANPAACQLLGYSEAELIGRPFRSILADDELEDDLLYQVLVQGLTSKVEGGYVSRNGKVTPVSFSSSRMLNHDGEIEGTVCVAQDITQRRRDHQALIEARQGALAASRAKSEFLATISHEIRTPMNAILGMANVLSATPLTREQKEYVKLFQSAGNSLLALINDILDISKIEAGRLELEETAFDLQDLMEDTVQVMALEAHQKGLELCLRIKEGTATTVFGDPIRLRQVVINLLGNAVKFTDAGEVILAVENYAGADAPGRLLFSISDTGVGIPPDKLDRIFETFTQADSSTTRKYGGTGLGLAISKQLVERMGGTIRAESEVGRGSTFRFDVPLSARGVPAQPEETDAGPLEGVKVLVVDPNDTNREIVTEMLVRQGAGTAAAPDGRSGLARLGQPRNSPDPYQLVVLNRRLPDLDGFDAARAVLEDYRGTGVVLMLTTENPSEDIARCEELGIRHHVVKPVRKSRLVEAIAEALGRPPVLKAAAASSPPAQEDQRPLSILLVEDYQNNRLVVQAYLSNTPHRIDIAENGEIAVQMFMSTPYDLVLMDLQMPVMDGYTATRMIREREAELDLPPTPIIALTANGSIDDTARCLEAGFNAHLGKPIDRQALLHTIKTYSGGVTV